MVVFAVQGKLGPAREVFDAFLRTYPYCYGYWKKYADFEKKNSSNDTAKEVCSEIVGL